jgi:expansin (peptidoglycan-binding protein)
MVTALNETDYGPTGAFGDAGYCGAFLRVNGPLSTIVVRVVDRCRTCRAGNLDLSPMAFERIAQIILGRVPINWQVISPPVSGPIGYHFKDGTHQWWTAVQIRNHRNPIARVDYRDAAGNWVNLPRTFYNYFAKHNVGAGPYTFRVTDIYGNVLIDSGIPHQPPGVVIPGGGQFPAGP